MPVRLDGSWQALDAPTCAGVAGHLGVYQLGDSEGTVLYIGAAGAGTRFGLRGELLRHCGEPPGGATRFRIEVTHSYHSRYMELVQAHLHDHGRMPAAQGDLDRARFGTLRPGGGPEPMPAGG